MGSRGQMSHLPLNLELQYRLIVTHSNKLIVPGGSGCKASACNAGDPGLILPAMREIWVWFLGREDPLEKEMAIHSSTFAWKIPWMEDLLLFMGSQRIGHDWATSLSTHSKLNETSTGTMTVPRWTINETGGKGAGLNFWKTDAAWEHNINQLKLNDAEAKAPILWPPNARK